MSGAYMRPEDATLEQVLDWARKLAKRYRDDAGAPWGDSYTAGMLSRVVSYLETLERIDRVLAQRPPS